ncbi:extracellular calcium-sensing receptor-like [Pleurodeles waltl]|uniref:extracellular calcium-sensing receptor-like n=1 Tax=Pleurodeles waltl TaxID=8319 RepID=UPI0037094B89
MVLHFGWTWVGLLAEDSDLGQRGIHVLQEELIKGGACIDFSENILTSRADKNAFHIVQVIRNSTAKAIIIFSNDADLVPVLNELVKEKVTGRLWVASDGWSTSAVMSMEKYSQLLSGTIGFESHSGEMPGFKEYTGSLQPSRSQDDVFIKEFWEESFGCKWLDQKLFSDALDNRTKMCTGLEKLESLQAYNNDVSRVRFKNQIYNAVYVLAWALHDLSSCRPGSGPFPRGTCADIISFQPWQVPTMVCTPSCPPGSRNAAREGKPICCFTCVQCPPGKISNQTDILECSTCPWDQWPNVLQDHCIQKIKEFLSFEEPLGAILTTTSIFLSVIPVAILGVFVRYRKTPIVRANNCNVSYLLLVSLSLCFLCPLSFIGYPTPKSCLIRQVGFGITFALCISCILAKIIIVLLAFNATQQKSDLERWARPTLSNLVISVGTLFQVILCFTWLSLSPPFTEYNIDAEPGKIIFECNEGSPIAFWCMLGYLGLLATVSFIVAFLARKLPDRFNEAQFITFSMLAFLIVWLSFIPAYLSTKGKYTVVMEIFAILSSLSSLVSCIFFPKCYIILWRPEMNTKECLRSRVTGLWTKEKKI